MKKQHAFELAKFVAESMDEKKGREITLIDLEGVADYTNYIVICTADSDIQTRAIAKWIEAEVSDNGLTPYKKEGFEALEWVILDYVDVVVHIFNPESREKYNLERMWRDADISDYVNGELTKAVSDESIESVKESIDTKNLED